MPPGAICVGDAGSAQVPRYPGDPVEPRLSCPGPLDLHFMLRIRLRRWANVVAGLRAVCLWPFDIGRSPAVRLHRPPGSVSRSPERSPPCHHFDAAT